MPNSRQITATLLALAIIIGLSACGGSGPQDEHRSHDEAEAHTDHDTHEGDDNHGAGESAEHQAYDEADDHGEEETDLVRLSPQEAENAGIITGKAEMGLLGKSLSLPAEIRFDADRVANVSPQVSGIITRLYAGEGDVVRRGQRLALVSSRELAGLKADYLTARTADDLAKAALEREEALFADRITSEADIQAARAAYAAAKAQREAAENKLHAIGITHAALEKLGEAEDGALANASVTAPLGGTVVRRTVTLGATVTAGDAGGKPLFTIVDASVVWADIAVYKQDASKIEPGLPVTIKSSAGDILAIGEIAFLLPVFDESSRTATARVIVDNPDGLLHPGQFVTAEIATQSTESVLRVPSSSLQLFEGRQTIFIPTQEGFEPRPVRVGNEVGEFTEIKSGLIEGETYVIEGAFTLRAQLEKAAFGSGHEH